MVHWMVMTYACSAPLLHMHAGRAVSEATGRTAPGQSLGINIIPEKLAAAKVRATVLVTAAHRLLAAGGCQGEVCSF